MKNGFTIIELMITITIVILMTVLAIPAFSRYEKNSEWAQKKVEISNLIEEYGLKVKNPEIGAVSYEIKVDNNQIKVYKNGGEVKSIITPSNYTVQALPVGIGNKMLCRVDTSTCCMTGLTSTSCMLANTNSDVDFILLSDGQSSATISVRTSPFIVKTK